MSDELLVSLGDVAVGTLGIEDDSPTFRFAREWCDLRDRPVLSLAFEDIDPSPSKVVREHDGSLPRFFRNLLPEGHLRKMLGGAVENRRHHEFYLLALVGDDLPGAVRVHSDPIEGAVLPPALPPQGFAFALSGVQFKLQAVEREQRLTVPVSGEGRVWIAKFGAPTYPELVENEWTLLTWASRCGLNVPPFALRHSREIDDAHGAIAEAFRGPVLLVERFDRHGATRVHQEDFAQILSLQPEQKYWSSDGVDETINYSTIGRIVGAHAAGDRFEFLRRIVFMVLSGNGDAHTKNWALLHPKPGQSELSPLYDTVCTIAYEQHHDRQLALHLSTELQIDRITRAHIIELASRMGEHVNDYWDYWHETVCAEIDAFVARARDEWRSLRLDARVPARVRRAIDQNLDLAAARQRGL
jgi:serine/threonine-protein kinase HipA